MMKLVGMKTWLAIVTLWLGVYGASQAQIFTAPLQASTSGTDPVDFEFRADGTLIAEGNYGVGSLLTADMGAGVRMLWFPSLGAFRAGAVDGTDWDQDNIGSFSFAGGFDTYAPGEFAVALGESCSAGGQASVALGQGTNAWGDSSVSLGCYASNNAYGAVALGYQTNANGAQSTAFGDWSYTTGWVATAFGSGTLANGDNSTAAGANTEADAYDSFVLGTYNLGGGTSNSWVASDPLFEIGNGTSTTPSDALVVYKNGNAVLQGSLQVAPTGDIPMYSGN